MVMMFRKSTSISWILLVACCLSTSMAMEQSSTNTTTTSDQFQLDPLETKSSTSEDEPVSKKPVKKEHDCIDELHGCTQTSENRASFSWDDLEGADESKETTTHQYGQQSNDSNNFLIGLFLFAAVWLLFAIMYSVLLLMVLNMQANGEVDIYDEDFGVLSLFGGSIKLHMGCILRRYAIQLDLDQHRSIEQQQRRGRRQIRIMTREERRSAIDSLLPLTIDDNNKCPILSCDDGSTLSPKKVGCDATTNIAKEDHENNCAICLCEYESNEQVYHSNICSHQFHRECILDWLERRSNTECPCCRDELVSESVVWKQVRKTRKKLKSQSKPSSSSAIKERLARWVLGRREGQALNSDHQDETSSSSTDLEDGQTNQILSPADISLSEA